MMEFRYKTRVEFYDVDSMDVVWHGNYIKYFEAARCAFLREIGYDYANFRDDGFALPVVKLDIKYIKPLFFGDEVEILVRLQDATTMLKLEYQVLKDGEILNIANSTQVCVDIQKRLSMYELPSGFYRALKAKYEN